MDEPQWAALRLKLLVPLPAPATGQRLVRQGRRCAGIASGLRAWENRSLSAWLTLLVLQSLIRTHGTVPAEVAMQGIIGDESTARLVEQNCFPFPAESVEETEPMPG